MEAEKTLCRVRRVVSSTTKRLILITFHRKSLIKCGPIFGGRTTKNKHINHFSKLVERFASSEAFVKREILLSAKHNEAFDWLREHKENYKSMDPWQKMAYIFCISGLPKDEKKFFISKCNFDRPFNTILSKWAKNKIG